MNMEPILREAAVAAPQDEGMSVGIVCAKRCWEPVALERVAFNRFHILLP